MAQKLYEESNIQAIADAIRAKNGLTDTYKTSEMADAIEAIPTGGGDLPEEAFLITGDCSYKFANGGWDWFVETYGNKVTTENIIGAQNMYSGSKVKYIPFELNMYAQRKISLVYMFQNCSQLMELPKINNCTVETMSNMFFGCYNLRHLPQDIEDWFDWSQMDTATSSYAGDRSATFKNCYSLRSIPVGFLSHANPLITYYYAYWSSGFQDCHSLDELELPIPYTATWTSNSFSSSFVNCFRLKRVVFQLQENGSPYVMNWRSQTIDLSNFTGYASSGSAALAIANYNSGITVDKRVLDNATYQALKDDPDWFTSEIYYSRYNHDSAVATINSLPDTSAYLASAGGSNTLKFRGAAGSKTDGGAINTLTAEEIAVATAKGWTVTLS